LKPTDATQRGENQPVQQKKKKGVSVQGGKETHLAEEKEPRVQREKGQVVGKIVEKKRVAHQEHKRNERLGIGTKGGKREEITG